MFIIQTITITLLVFLVPGVALRPTLALQPRTSLALPFISLIVVIPLQVGLAITGNYNPPTVQLLSMVLAVVAVWRLSLASRRSGDLSPGWRHYDAQVFIIALALCIYFSPMLLAFGFDKDDEIYSWNMWAIQHFLGEPVDLSYTRAPYPQLFPRLLSYGYMLLGSVELQTAVKTSLIVFPFLFFSMLGLASAGNRYLSLVLYLMLSLFVLREMDIKHIFDDGMPDTMMSVGVAVSVYFFLLFRQCTYREEYLWLAVACSTVAVLSKQPALYWSMASMPVLMAYGCWKRDFRPRHLFIALLPALVGAIWVLTEGQDFHDNTGVTGRSFADRDYTEQLLFSFRTYFLDDWKLAALYLVGIASCFKNRAQLGVLIAFTLPSTVFWLLFAAYDLRAGIPAILTMCLFIANGNYLAGTSPSRGRMPAFNPALVYSASLLLLLFALSDAYSSLERHRAEKDPGFELGKPLRNNLVRLFPADADKIYAAIMDNDDARIWAPSHYVYGLFYGYADVTRPRHRHSSYSASELLEELRSTGRNFVTNSGDVPAGPAGALLDELATRQCPDMFTLFSGPGNRYGLLIYQLDTELLYSNYCEAGPE